MEVDKKWLSVEQIADYLSISKETIYRWLDRGVVPAHRVGKLWRFQAQEIDAWVKAGGAAATTRRQSQTPQTNLE